MFNPFISHLSLFLKYAKLNCLNFKQYVFIIYFELGISFILSEIPMFQRVYNEKSSSYTTRGKQHYWFLSICVYESQYID